MDKFLFHLKYAARSLLRDKTRTILAIFCIAFGTLSIVAMQTLTNSFISAIDVDPLYDLKGDVTMTKNGGNFNAEDFAQFDTFKKAGQLEDYTYTIESSYGILQTKTGKLINASDAIGIDALKYPFYGKYELQENKNLADAIKERGTVVITEDLAKNMDVKIGDNITYKPFMANYPVTMRVTGILTATPDKMGNTLLYNLETALDVTHEEDPRREVILKKPSASTMTALTDLHQYYFTTPSVIKDVNEKSIEVFSFAFNGAGIMGLIIGGIGIANTLQVVLKRRQNEIAILKSVGFKKQQLFWIFIIETALLGIVGAIVGAGLALVFANQLTMILRSTGGSLITTSINWLSVSIDIILGVLTAAIFGTHAIIKVVNLKPIEIFREENSDHVGKIQSGFIMIGLFILFSLISSYILSSLSKGFLITVIAAVASAVIGFLLKLVMKLMLAIPLPTPNLLRFPKNHLKQNLQRLVFPILALVAGISAITFTANVVNTADRQLADKDISMKGFNTVIYASSENRDRIINSLQGKSYVERYALNVTAVDNVPFDFTLEARSNNDFNQEVSKNPDFKTNNAVYLSDWYNPENTENENFTVKPGTTVRFSYNEQIYTLEVAGFYKDLDINRFDNNLSGLIVSEGFFKSLNSNSTPVYLSKLSPEAQDKLSKDLSILPGITVYTEQGINSLNRFAYQSLFSFVVAVASLALVAGAVLIANTVGLDLLERQKEIGIIKALGYTRGQVITQLLFEFGFIGFVAGLFGLLISYATVPLMNLVEKDLNLIFNWPISIGMMFFSIAIALVTTLLISFRPTSVKPLTVLRAE